MDLHGDTIVGFLAVIGFLWKISSKITAHLKDFDEVRQVQQAHALRLRRHGKRLRLHDLRFNRLDPPAAEAKPEVVPA